MSTFWISNENATGPGFGMFSPTHIAVLVVLAIISYFIIQHYMESRRRKQIRITIAFTILALEIVKDLALLVTHQFTVGNLPFQLCGIGIFIVIYDVFYPGKTSQALMYCLTLPGAMMAVLTPDWVTNNLLDFFVFQSFFIHCLLVTYVLMQLFAKEFRPDFRQIWRTVIFIIIIAPIMLWLNHIWNTNFWFLEIPVAGSPLQFVHVIFGQLYIVGMIVLVSLFWLFMYLPWTRKKAL